MGDEQTHRRSARETTDTADRAPGRKARRRADQAMLAAYHEARLAELLEHVRAGFAEYDAGRLDAFDLDALVHRYHRAAQELWKFCAVSGAAVETAARTLELLVERGEQPDWWGLAERRGR